MAYRLGLDVGTASCGLVAWHLDETGHPVSLPYYSLDIWQEPLLPAKSGGVGEPKKAARRAARMMRRGICRRARRLRRIAYLAERLGLDRHQIASDSGQQIHALRARAAEERIELSQLIPVLLHLAKNRGPSGDWVYSEPERKSTKEKKRDADDETRPTEGPDEKAIEMGKIVGGVRHLEALMAEAALELGKDSITLGQYLNLRRQKKISTTLGPAGLYPSRRMVEQEFARIWDTQSAFYAVMRDADTCEQFRAAIFDQRPLKSPAPMVGRCPLEPTLPRSPAAQMAAQAFRIEKQIADLRWGMGRRAEQLNSQQRETVRTLLHNPEMLTAKGELSFKKLLDELRARGFPGPGTRGLNMDRASRDSLKGNTTLVAFHRLGLLSAWQALDDKTQVQIINFLADLGSPEALDGRNWHLNFKTTSGEKRKFSEALVTFINCMRDKSNFDRLSKMGFESGRMSYSIKALGKLNALMQEGWDERTAIDQAYPEYHKPRAASLELPLPPETGNTVVDVAMRQVYRAVRKAMEALGGPPTEVIVELSRDMALGVGKRNEIESKIDKNRKARLQAKNALETQGQESTERNIQRYLLWESQGHYCPYCADRISIGDALSAATEREHILPRSLTRVGGKRNQLVLAHRACNQQKENRTPWQAFGADENRWQRVKLCAEMLTKSKQWGKAKLLLKEDWEEEVLDDEAIQGFSDRQFHESSWIAKLTAQWLGRVCPPTERNGQPVMVSRGELTAHLRRIWKLNTVIPEVRFETGLPVLDEEGKAITRVEFDRHRLWWDGQERHAGAIPADRRPDKRIDHRHHIVDALVISLTSRSLFVRMAQNYKLEREREKRGERARMSLHEAPPIPLIRDLALEIVRNVEIRHKRDHHPDGALFDQTAYGRSRKPDEGGSHLLTSSKRLASLIDPANAGKTRGRLETIESEKTREIVLSAFEQRLRAGKSLKQIFDEPVVHPQYGTHISRVRLLRESEHTAAVVRHKNRHGQMLEKRYTHSGNAYLEIMIEDGKLVGAPRLVNIQEAMLEKSSRPPHGVRRFWKGDTIQDARDGKSFVIRQIKSEGGGALIGALNSEAREVRDLTAASGYRMFKGKSLAKLTVI
ncbi:CRISPR-associated endonuclease, Csn1 family [Solimonas aquatica]|uniref:CRISPR-associated endonuclease, Csn1 family n=1 Tax=Solimonas aquatica TaxID=489703 RepID=A0A1H9LTS3_9GAMM|nr:type II CRISPR RNA-guided endonuclease Cas9 [Solimonas aquatica]SER14861.1 CRISPR-associated endonuclease, Csn1 family [Solimonas aquatica]